MSSTSLLSGHLITSIDVNSPTQTTHKEQTFVCSVRSAGGVSKVNEVDVECTYLEFLELLSTIPNSLELTSAQLPGAAPATTVTSFGDINGKSGDVSVSLLFMSVPDSSLGISVKCVPSIPVAARAGAGETSQSSTLTGSAFTGVPILGGLEVISVSQPATAAPWGPLLVGDIILSVNNIRLLGQQAAKSDEEVASILSNEVNRKLVVLRLHSCNPSTTLGGETGRSSNKSDKDSGGDNGSSFARFSLSSLLQTIFKMKNMDIDSGCLADWRQIRRRYIDRVLRTSSGMDVALKGNTYVRGSSGEIAVPESRIKAAVLFRRYFTSLTRRSECLHAQLCGKATD